MKGRRQALLPSTKSIHFLLQVVATLWCIVLFGVPQSSLAFSVSRPSSSSTSTSTSTSTSPSGRRQRSTSRPRRSTDDGNTSSSVGPKGPRDGSERRRSRQRRSSKQQEGAAGGLFDPKLLTQCQKENKNASALSLFTPKGDENLDNGNLLRLRPTQQGLVSSSSDKDNDDDDKKENREMDVTKNDSLIKERRGKPIKDNQHFEQISLDELFPLNNKDKNDNLNISFSKAFHTDSKFREDIRHAIREDIFDTTPAYIGLSPKVKAMMLDDDSSVQGTWNCIPRRQKEQEQEQEENVESNSLSESPPIRMKQLTNVLQLKLGANAPTGDEFMMALGGLCGHNPSTHWMDIIGVKDRVVNHSWHQDTGRSHSRMLSTDDHDDHELEQKESCYTVMLGFPCEDEYEGTGVFSHVIKLTEEHWAPEGLYSGNEPVLFEGTTAETTPVDEEYVVRPSFGLGKEILRYRDIDVVHSAPDVIYRSSIMRFM